MTRAVALIVQDGLVALIERRWEGEAPYYLFPGGKVETGETAEVTVVREVKEELGLDVSVGPLAAEVSYEGSFAVLLSRINPGRRVWKR
jgi:8-oxo-dGTP diphosphatase